MPAPPSASFSRWSECHAAATEAELDFFHAHLRDPERTRAALEKQEDVVALRVEATRLLQEFLAEADEIACSCQAPKAL